MKPNLITDLSHQVSNYWNPNFRTELNIWDEFIPNKQSGYKWNIIDKKDWYYIITDWKNTHTVRI